MVDIDSIVDLYGFVGFPLGEDAIGSGVDILIMFLVESWVVDVDLVSFDIDDFSIDPFVFVIADVYILT